MKRKAILYSWLALLLAGALLLGFAACGGTKPVDAPTSATQPLSTAGYEEPSSEDATEEPAAWRVEVRGVPGIVKFDSADAQALPKVEAEMTTTNTSGFTVTNRYGGVTLRSLLAYLGVQYVSTVTVSSLDGNAVTYNAEMAMADNTLLAWEMDGAPIDAEPPLRMCPGSGPAEMYVKLVSSITVMALSPDQVTTTAPTLPFDYSHYVWPSNYYDPPQPPVYTTWRTTTRTTAPVTTSSNPTVTTTAFSTDTTATTEPTTTATTTTATTRYTYPPDITVTTRATITTTTTTASTVSTTTTASRPSNIPPDWPWP